MTELLDCTSAAARRLSPDARDDIARSVLFLAGEEVRSIRSGHGSSLGVGAGGRVVA